MERELPAQGFERVQNVEQQRDIELVFYDKYKAYWKDKVKSGDKTGNGAESGHKEGKTFLLLKRDG